jgi:hypothetical protein
MPGSFCAFDTSPVPGVQQPTYAQLETYRSRPSRDEAETDGFIGHAATEADPVRMRPAVDAEKSGCFFGERAGKR